jgi:hypothetical protein
MNPDPITPDRECSVKYDRHPDLPWLVAICVRPAGHGGGHNNVLPKTLEDELDDGGWRCAHEWLDRPESDTRECLICGVER